MVTCYTNDQGQPPIHGSVDGSVNCELKVVHWIIKNFISMDHYLIFDRLPVLTIITTCSYPVAVLFTCIGTLWRQIQEWPFTILGDNYNYYSIYCLNKAFAGLRLGWLPGRKANNNCTAMYGSRVPNPKASYFWLYNSKHWNPRARTYYFVDFCAIFRFTESWNPCSV